MAKPNPPSDQDTSKVFGAMTLRETFTDYVGRPVGKAGRAIPLHANMYQVRYKKAGLNVFHYDVTIAPVVKRTGGKNDRGPPRDKLQKIWNQAASEAKGDLKIAFDHAAFDFVKNAYTPTPFPMNGQKLEVTTIYSEDGPGGNPDERDRWKLTIVPAETGRGMGNDHVIELDSITEFCKGNKMTEAAKEKMLVAVQAMNILFRQDVSNRYKASGAQGRRFFTTEGAVPVPDGALVYNGFMQSFRFTNSGLPAIQLDTAYSAFVHPGPILNVIPDLLGRGRGGGFGGGRGGRGGARGAFGGRGGAPGGGGVQLQELTSRDVQKLNGILRNAKFQVTHRQSNKIFTLKAISYQPASDTKFLLNGKNGEPDRMVFIPDYLRQTYNVQVTKPRLPCVIFGKNYIPLEFVKLVEFNSVPFAKLTADQTAAMIKVAAKPPPERKAKIVEWRNKLDWGNLPKVRSWNVEVNPNMMQVTGRVLQPPAITYTGGTQRPNGGQWNMRGTKYAKAGKSLKSWSVVVLDKRMDRQTVQGFIGRLVQNLRITNCPVENGTPPIVDGVQNRRFSVMQGWNDIKIALQAGAREAYMASKADPQLVVVILPNKDLARYAEIKRCAAQDLKAPIVTQLLGSQKVRPDNRGMDQYIGNVSMKVHAKLGGVTHHVQHPAIDKSTMMIGADVTHPPPQRANVLIPPSIALSVAAISGDNNLFRPAIRLQEGRKETITDLVGMMIDHINVFVKNTGKKPEKIIMFRDGVSEGQYAKCATEEYDAMLKAAREIDPRYRPKITFVVCVKRHAMRFFAANSQDCDRTGNLPPGTVVDTGVCHPFAFDFYLQAHSGLQGTARPTHYMVVKDDIGFDADKMQNLCNALCYSYARACRSVSLIPVAYYSDIIAGKCRDLIYRDDSDGTPSVSEKSGPQGTATYDPNSLKNRLEASSTFNSVAWYM